MAKTLKNEDLRLNLIVHGDSAKKFFFEAATAAAKIKEELNLAEQALAAKKTQVGEASKEYKKLLKDVL